MNTLLNSDFDSFLTRLADKWREVPGSTQDRLYSSALLSLPDSELRDTWQGLYDNNCCGDGYSVRGWYHDLYADLAARGGRWLEVGSGLGYDGIHFARCGAKVTFLDIVVDNLKVIERICEIDGIGNVEFIHMDRFERLRSLGTFDCVLAVGSLINAPFEMMSQEREEIGRHLLQGGRWLELCYPEERWVREGSLPFSEWGKKTDGERTPWVEWYNVEKLLLSLAPHKFEPVLATNFHNHDFNWFDLIRRG